MVEVYLKNDSRRFYFDCVVNAIVKGGDVTGASVLARDVTGHREKEQRFTQLFESLQEGVYISNPEGKLLEVNPALVTILGYDSKEDLLKLTPDRLSVDAGGDPVLGRGGSQSGRTRTREIRLEEKMAGSLSAWIHPAALWRANASSVTRARWWTSPKNIRWNNNCAGRKSSADICWKVSRI